MTDEKPHYRNTCNRLFPLFRLCSGSHTVVLESDNYLETSEGIKAAVKLTYNGKTDEVIASGNGRLDAVSNALKQVIGKDYVLDAYAEHALEEKSSSLAASYVSVRFNNKTYWGAGIHSDIFESSVLALFSAVNRMLVDQK